MLCAHHHRLFLHPSDCLSFLSCWTAKLIYAEIRSVLLSCNVQDSPVLSSIPPTFLSYLPASETLPHPLHLATPLYINPERSRAIAQLQLPVSSVEEAEQWTLAGVAFVLAA